MRFSVTTDISSVTINLRTLIFNRLIDRALSKPPPIYRPRLGRRMDRKRFTDKKIEDPEKALVVCLEAESYIVKC